MKTTVKLVLDRPARKAGSDRYQIAGREDVLYIPQDISRPSGEPVEVINVTFDTGDK